MAKDRALTDAQIETLVERLVGTTGSLDVVLEEEFGLDLDDISIVDTAIFDSKIFCCERCDWWCLNEEMSENEDWVCDECALDNEGG